MPDGEVAQKKGAGIPTGAQGEVLAWKLEDVTDANHRDEIV